LKIVVLLGPPGSGKGTLAASLSEHLRLAVFVIGDALRTAIDAESKLGERVKADVEAGRLVDDETILALAREFLRTHPEGVLLDGFPRTIRQAEGLRSLLSAEDELHVVYLDASEETVTSRLSSRRVCPGCGEIYNMRFKPPKNDGVCDNCGATLIRRKDDTEEVIRERYRVYLRETAPLVDYFADGLIRVDGNLAGDEAFESVRGELCPA
jgi:adenylate kinase